MPRIFVHAFSIPAAAIDVNRHVNNLVYLHWMLEAATAHSAAQGWPLERYLAAGCGWFVRSHFIEYLQPAFAGDALLLYTWVKGMAGRTSARSYLVLRERDGAAVAKAETLWVFVDFRSGRPVRIPPDIVAAFPVVADDDAELAALTPRRPAARRARS